MGMFADVIKSEFDVLCIREDLGEMQKSKRLMFEIAEKVALYCALLFTIAHCCSLLGAPLTIKSLLTIGCSTHY